MGCCEGKLPNPDERLAADSIVAFGSLEHGTQLAQVRLSEASNPDLYVCAFFLPLFNWSLLLSGCRAVSLCGPPCNASARAQVPEGAPAPARGALSSMQPGNVSAGRWIQCSGPGSVGLRHLEAFGFSQNRGMPPCLSKSSSKYWVTPWSCCLSQINRDEGVGAPETRLGVHVRNAGLSSWVCGHLSVQFVSQDCGARRAWGRLTPEAGALPAPLLRAARLRSALPDSGLFQCCVDVPPVAAQEVELHP